MEQNYMNFPVILLQDYMKNPANALYDILSYCFVSLEECGGDAKGILNITNTRREFVKNGKDLYERFRWCGSPFTGMKQDVFFDYYNNYKTDFEHVCLLAYLAMKSIIGNDGYKKTTNMFIWSRMAGEVKTVSNINYLYSKIRHYCTRYYFDKIKLELEENWHLSYYSTHTRGLYISFKLPLEDVIKYAEVRKLTLREQRAKHNKIIEEAKRNLTNIPP